MAVIDVGGGRHVDPFPAVPLKASSTAGLAVIDVDSSSNVGPVPAVEVTVSSTAGVTVIETVAGAESRVPSFTLKVNESGPL